MKDNIEHKSFKQLLHESFKSEDTEEWLDVHFTRPIGLFFALIWKRLGVHPNTITILSIFLGMSAGACFYFRDLWCNIAGVVLLMFANFCDSTDGQLARLTNQRTIIGRCLDGFAGDTWFFAIYLAIILRVWPQFIPGTEVRWGIGIFALCAVAGIICHAQQSSLADYYRQIHLLFLKGEEGSELSSYESEHAYVESLKGKSGMFWERAFHSNYQNYCKSQEHRTPYFQRLMKKGKEKYGNIALTPSYWRDEFLAGSRPLMPQSNLLTFNSRAIIVYVTCLLDFPWVYPLLEITVFQLMYIYMHRRHEALCKEMAKKL